MNAETAQLVRDVIDLTGAPPPAWLEDDAPVLAGMIADDHASDGDEGFYLVGIIGGKDIGKSALVNALVGQRITEQTSHGPGTETVVAYAHQSQAEALRALLEREVPGKFAVVTHALADLRRQVLLDLPDIDSHYAEHVAVTRRMLRHMLFPVWMQSVEKYADRQPQEMLARVAAGNAPANFVFCLNKVDQLEGLRGQLRPGEADPMDELREDYAQRLARVLELPGLPKVWMIAATRPGQYELPALRALLARQKSPRAVRESRQGAARRQEASALAWLGRQNLTTRGARLGRLYDEAAEAVRDRLGGPLLGGVIPRLMDDPQYRGAICAESLAKRVARWPVVNFLHGFFAVVGGFFRRNAEPRPRPLLGDGAESLVDAHLSALSRPAGPAWPGASAAGAPPAAPPLGSAIESSIASPATGASPAGAPFDPPDHSFRPGTGATLATLVQSTFAQLQQTHGVISGLYRDRKLWESMPASLAAADLRRELSQSVERQRQRVADRVVGADRPAWKAGRWALTLGATVWFPLVQPVLRLALSSHEPVTFQRLLTLAVEMLGLTYLLNAATSLLLYFLALWLILRWDTQRKVGRLFAGWRSAGLAAGAAPPGGGEASPTAGDPAPPLAALPALATEASLSPVGRTLAWMQSLLEPIRQARRRVDEIVRRVEALEAAVGPEPAASAV